CKEKDKLPPEEREEKKGKLKQALLDCPCPPSRIVITKNGLQPRWRIDEPKIDESTQRKYRNVIEGIIKWSKKYGNAGDPIKDVARVLRKPGYYHHKSDPYLVTEELGSDKTYTLDELANGFFLKPTTELKVWEPIPTIVSDNQVFQKIASLDIQRVAIDVQHELGHNPYFNDLNQLGCGGGSCKCEPGKTWATFVNRDGKNFISNGGTVDHPAQGNAVTYVARVLSISNKDAFKWLLKKYDIKSEIQNQETKKGGDGDVNQADKLVKFICDDPTIILFHDELDIAYANFAVNEHTETLSVNSSAFKFWIAKSFYNLYKKTINQNTLATALQTIAGKARFDGEAVPLYNRTAMIEGVIWYDLADKEWGTVKITINGWEVIDNSPIIFKRQQHHAAQVAPAGGGDIRDILRFINITNENQQLLFLVLLVSYFIPGFPHPIAYIYGPQGSAKSTFSKIKRKLVDPSRIEVLSLPKKEEDLIQVLSQHHMLFFDNVGSISDSVADLLCRAVTGSGFSKRQLYTDNEVIIYDILANVGINGISLSSSKPDLLERSMLFELRRVEKAGRRQERELLEEFERERPKILGAIFETITKALVLYPSIHVTALPRMADFALWGCAIAEAIGTTKEVFLNAYEGSINSQNDEVLSEHVEAELLGRFMEDKERWDGTASELRKHLCGIAGSMDISESELPKNGSALSRKLNTLKTNLEEAGLKIEKGKGTRRIITIRKTSANAADADDAVQCVVGAQQNEDDIADDNCRDSLLMSSDNPSSKTLPKDSEDDINGIFPNSELETHYGQTH
ncbi:MAG: hypothetical protein HZA36_03365, partial [Parcubacteria group bacterium]|nr:hypothetical protein [Parcubacteria group bacterium]